MSLEAKVVVLFYTKILFYGNTNLNMSFQRFNNIMSLLLFNTGFHVFDFHGDRQKIRLDELKGCMGSS